MRVTNGMIRNNMLNSLYTNMNRLDTLYNQMNTLKKVQRPSDDPIITGRALKLKLNVLETQQHQHNVKEATSWMEVSQTALSNVTEIIKDISYFSIKCCKFSCDSCFIC
jgi:flagellar hook-associated protein 3 FlgL